MFFNSKFSYSNSNSSYSDLLLDIDSGNIEAIYFYPRRREIDVLYKNGKKEKIPILYNDQLILEKATENKVELTINNSRKESSTANSFASLGLFLIFLVAIVLILKSTSNLASRALGFGKNKSKFIIIEDVETRFDDVAGVPEAAAELKEVITFLKEPKKYTDLGARVPKGVLLFGPPGTGKTTAAEGYVEQLGYRYSDYRIIGLPESSTISELETNYTKFHESVMVGLEQGVSLVIADAPNESPDRYEGLVKKAKDLGYNVKLINFMEGDIESYGLSLGSCSQAKTLKYLNKLSKRSKSGFNITLMMYLAILCSPIGTLIDNVPHSVASMVPRSSEVYTSPPGMVTAAAPKFFTISNHAPEVLNFNPLRSSKFLTGFLECKNTSDGIIPQGIEIKPYFSNRYCFHNSAPPAS